MEKIKKSSGKFTKDERMKVVAEIESGRLSFKQAQEKYNVVSSTNLKSWIIQYANNPESIVQKPTRKHDKRQAAYKIITGESTVEKIARDFKVSTSTVNEWVRIYKKDLQGNPSNQGVDKPKTKNEISDRTQEKELEDLKMKVAGLEMMIDIAEKELKIEIRKKSGTKQ